MSVFVLGVRLVLLPTTMVSEPVKLGAGDPATDRDLIEKARGGDYGAFEALVVRYRDRVFRLAYGMTRSASDAEEVAQEAFLSLFRALDGYRGDSSPSSWIYRIVTNAALMRLRSKRRKPLLAIEDYAPGDRGDAVGLWPTGSWSSPPEASALGRELREKIERAVMGLPEKYRLVLLLRDVEGLGNEETAQSLGLTVPTVKTRLHRARLMVRKALDGYFNDT